MQEVPKVTKTTKIDKIKTHVKRHKDKYLVAGGVAVSVAIGYAVGRSRTEFKPSNISALLREDGSILTNFWDRENRLPDNAMAEIRQFAKDFPADAHGMNHIVEFIPIKKNKKEFRYVLGYATPID